MKRLFLLGIVVIILVYIAPVSLQFYQNHTGNAAEMHTVKKVEMENNTQATAQQNAADDDVNAQEDVQADTQADTPTDADILLSVSVDGETVRMPLEDYVAGAVAAEMPASFPLEALKAQAVAARTYAVYKRSLGEDATHPDAVVCDDYTHCAAFVDLDTQSAALWGKKSEEWTQTVRQAAQETAGRILTYDGAPIAAVFHAAAAGKTEDAVNVWGSDVPYLVGVDSDGDADCPKYDASVTLRAEEFRQIMLEQYPDINLTGLPKTWFTDIDSSEAGGVISCKIGGKELKGTAVRGLFGLNSTHFTISTTDTSITFHTEGYGHGVGMSQYGAKAMAEDGGSYEDILLHYYTDTEIESVTE